MSGYCRNIAKLCNNLIVSTAVDYDATTNTLNITIPDGTYANHCKYCLVVAQVIPATTTIGATVYIFTNGGSFQLVGRNCVPVTAAQIRTRTKYSMVVQTTTTSGVFRLCETPCVCCPETLAALPVSTATAAPTALASVPVGTYTTTTTTKTTTKREA